ncbi:MAG: MFS transporter [Pseudomonadota bacterium]
MYRIEWIERLKLGGVPGAPDATPLRVSPVVISLGFTSLFTDISSEMVNSLLPAWLVLHLHMSPMQFGVIDGLYNGFAIALLSLAAGYLADRSARQKEVALAGYSLSGLCKLLLLGVGATWGWILLVVGLDRAGKGIRAAPRDALISLNTPPAAYAMAFSVHRAMDACGSLLGPITAFALLALLPGAYDAVWVTSFFFAVIGVAVLWLFVPSATALVAAAHSAAVTRPAWSPWKSRRFLALTACGALLAGTTISDGFLYLLLQQKSAAPTGFFPLFYVVTAAAYMLLSIPAGRLADRTSRSRVFLGGYAVLVVLYILLLFVDRVSTVELVGCLILFGLFYAGTEGILMALVSVVIPPAHRTSGIAIVGTAIGITKLLSSVAFGALWQWIGIRGAVITFVLILGLALAVSLALMRATDNDS